jgi:adenylate cyclase
MLRLPIIEATAEEFPSIRDFRTAGMTDYVALINRFAADKIIGEMDCILSSWVTDAPDGFAEPDIAALQRLVPFLALAMKSASLGRIAETLVETYLGRDAGRRVLKGRIARGVADRISTVLWFSDLRGFTRITDTAPPEHIIPLLNDYADAVVSAVHDEGGDVLKLIGDGTLAIFRADERERACGHALAAASTAHQRIAALNEQRASDGLPTTEMYLGLHVGEVFYGNVGSKDRLDFTVVGPAVNEASRIAAMCRSVDQPVLVSSAFATASGEARRRLVSIGRYALRGVGRPQELFTLDPETGEA